MLQLEDAEICRAVVDSLELGVHVIGRDHKIRLWNRAAEKITGYPCAEVLGRRCCDDLRMHCALGADGLPCAAGCPLKSTLEDGEARHAYAYLRHKMGHTVPVRLRTFILRGANGEAVGAAESFSEMQEEAIGEEESPLLRGIPEPGTPRTHEYIESWLERSLHGRGRDSRTFGVLQMQVDQLARLRVTHGREASEALMRVVSQTLVCSLHSSDIFGRWNDTDFLVIAHDANARALELDADLLRTLVKSAEFRWWGDRIPLTVSVGGTMAHPGDRQGDILARLGAALKQSIAGGGDRVAVEAGEGPVEVDSCSR